MHKQISISWGKCQMGKESRRGDGERLTSVKNLGRTNISRGPNQKLKRGQVTQ